GRRAQAAERDWPYDRWRDRVRLVLRLPRHGRGVDGADRRGAWRPGHGNRDGRAGAPHRARDDEPVRGDGAGHHAARIENHLGTQPVDDAAAYCREIETYLCRKNDGHLIRVVGPSFELVSGWARRGVPLKIAFRGIDRYFERYYRKGPR